MKCGPDGCPIVAFSDLTATEQRVQRKRIAEKMYKQGFTMEQIAKQLDVAKSTISEDLSDCSPVEQSKRRKTASNPRGSGRPKGNAKDRQRDKASATIKSMETAGEAITEKAVVKRAGVGKGTADVAITAHFAAKEAAAEAHQIAAEDQAIAAAGFSDKGKLKIADAIRIHKARLDKQFEARVNAEVRRRIDAADDATRKHNKELLQENLRLQRIAGQRGVFTKTQFRQMQMLCHPDNSASEQLRAQLSQILVDSEIRLVKSEK